MRTEEEVLGMYLYELELANANAVLVPLLEIAGKGYKSECGKTFLDMTDEERKAECERVACYLGSVTSLLKQTTVKDVLSGWTENEAHRQLLMNFILMNDFIREITPHGYLPESAQRLPDWERIQTARDNPRAVFLAMEEISILHSILAA